MVPLWVLNNHEKIKLFQKVGEILYNFIILWRHTDAVTRVTVPQNFPNVTKEDHTSFWGYVSKQPTGNLWEHLRHKQGKVEAIKNKLSLSNVIEQSTTCIC